jgi:hypothetical protein
MVYWVQAVPRGTSTMYTIGRPSESTSRQIRPLPVNNSPLVPSG